MKKLLLLGAAVLGLCTFGQTVQAGPDEPDYNYQRPAPRQYDDRPVEPRYYLPPPPPPVYLAPPPVVFGFGYPRFHRHYAPYRYGRPYGYGYGYGYRPGVHIGIGF